MERDTTVINEKAIRPGMYSTVFESFTSDYLSGLVETFTHPRKRLFVGYVALALLLGFIWLRWKGQGWGQ